MKATNAERDRNNNAQTPAGIVGNTTIEQLEAAAIRTAAILKELLEAAPNTPAETDERNKGIVKCLDALADFREAIRATA